jgi:putative Ca2+/H+ antiporter (TMEM165/GDT1 family)
MTQVLTIFLTVFLAELGDKTQLAALLFAANGRAAPWQVFFAASTALACSTALAVFLGAEARRFVDGLPLKLIAGLAFVAIGGFMLWDHFRSA